MNTKIFNGQAPGRNVTPLCLLNAHILIGWGVGKTWGLKREVYGNWAAFNKQQRNGVRQLGYCVRGLMRRVYEKMKRDY
jgi:hypothetical protein